LGVDLAIGRGRTATLLGLEAKAARETASLAGGEEVREMRAVSRIAAAISSLVALVLAGGAAWKI
jgi:hypothetical protein